MKALLSIIGLLILASSIQAATVIPGTTYILGDHPEANLDNTDMGGIPPITYGLRLDQLGGDPEDRTFSVEQDLASVTLFWNIGGDNTAGTADDTVLISGIVSRNSDDSFWDLSYTLTGISEVLGPNGGFTATDGIGTLTEQANMANVISLEGEENNQNLVFTALGDGHRLAGDSTSEVARGWLLPDGTTDDFLVTLTPVPLPAAAWLFMSALGLFAGISRRKSLS